MQGTGRGSTEDEQSCRCQHGRGQQSEHVRVGHDVDADHGTEDDPGNRTGHQLTGQGAVELAAAEIAGEAARAGDDVVEQVGRRDPWARHVQHRELERQQEHRTRDPDRRGDGREHEARQEAERGHAARPRLLLVGAASSQPRGWVQTETSTTGQSRACGCLGVRRSPALHRRRMPKPGGGWQDGGAAGVEAAPASPEFPRPSGDGSCRLPPDLCPRPESNWRPFAFGGVGCSHRPRVPNRAGPGGQFWRRWAEVPPVRLQFPRAPGETVALSAPTSLGAPGQSRTGDLSRSVESAAPQPAWCPRPESNWRPFA